MTALEGKMVRILGALSASLIVLAACGGGGAAPATGAPTAAAGAAGDAAVTAEGFAFKPLSVEVKAGGKVTWTNKDGAPHTTTSGKPGAKDGRWDGQLAASNGTFSFTFAQAGTYDFFCAIHTSMTGQVVVK
jgi:plastocyanin